MQQFVQKIPSNNWLSMFLNQKELSYFCKLQFGHTNPTKILSNFGSPPMVVRSLWAGLMTWRSWRTYVKITSGLTLTDNFISYGHYMTEEFLVHSGINHQLALYYAFPHLDEKDYSMRNTGNRGLEAIHSIFRGGSSSLPITAPNLTFGC